MNLYIRKRTCRVTWLLLAFCCLVQSVIFLSGCHTSDEVRLARADVRQQTATEAHNEVLRVQTALAPRLAAIDPEPTGRAAILRSLEAFALALSQQDVAACPEDFRAKYNASLNAWIASATLYKKQALYYRTHRDEDPEQGGTPSTEAQQLASVVAGSLETALARNKELRDKAESYGVTWQ